MPESIVVTVAEAATMLRLDPRTVRDLYRKGRIAGNQTGHSIRLNRESVVGWSRGRSAGDSGKESP